jgi:nucleoside-diphosphate-sugar epimerase
MSGLIVLERDMGEGIVRRTRPASFFGLLEDAPNLSTLIEFWHQMNTASYSANDNAPSVLILGGSGFIGTRLARLLKECGIRFRIGDTRPSEAFPDLWSECDVRAHQTLLQVMRGSDVIVNLAAEHRDDVRPISRYHETNVHGASEVCLGARISGVKKLVFASSVAVYGFHSSAVDECGSLAPFNAYGQTKLEAETVCRAWAEEDPSRTLVVVRPTVVFGEGNRGNVYNLIKQIASGRFVMIGSGNNVKSISYVGNVAAFLVRVLSLGPGAHLFNYVDGPDMRTSELVALIRARLGKRAAIPRIPFPIALLGGHALDVLARISGRTFPISAIRVRKFCENTQFRTKSVRQIGFVPPFALDEALRRTITSEFPQFCATDVDKARNS